MNPINVVLASGKEVLPMNEALMDAGIVILIVFAVLFIIFCLISISGAIFAAIDKSAKEKVAAAPAPATPVAQDTQAQAAEEEEFSSGTLKLKGCDEKTAAMIMAIVSDNTGIPLSELVFKSITLVEEKN